MVNNKSVSVIAAVCRRHGIGVKGRLPWRLKNEMAHFTRVTTAAAEGKRNVVIMGRKTWQSIPAKYRPLANRVNVVLSRSLQEVPSGAHYLFSSLSQAIQELSNDETIDKLFVIGGQKVYEEALASNHCQYVYLTRIEADFECDAFFPPIDDNLFIDVSSQADDIPHGPQQESDFSYRFFLYRRIS